MRRDPERPSSVTEYAKACLESLADRGLGDRISLGGAFGLLHYLDYRPTHDIDAWWVASATGEERQQVIHLLEETLASFGEVRVRRWGDVISIELSLENKVVFSFQIAHRSAQLEASVVSPWGIPLDSLTDLVASKMVALVERGAPRDLLDIYTVCQAGLVTPKECWELWRRRQQLAGSDTDLARARLAVGTHLERIALHRPLSKIEGEAARTEAARLRRWFREEFLNAG